MQLLRYLNLLKSWNCTEQLQKECSSKSFNFNELSYKMYLSVCDPAKFNTTCKVQNSESFILNTTSEKYYAEPEVIEDSCGSVRQFYGSNPESYAEIFNMELIMCSVVWCGVHYDAIENISLWDCAPQRLFEFLFLLV